MYRFRIEKVNRIENINPVVTKFTFDFFLFKLIINLKGKKYKEISKAKKAYIYIGIICLVVINRNK